MGKSVVGSVQLEVSVPLPGFSGLRLLNTVNNLKVSLSFSPVAGIQWVETLLNVVNNLKLSLSFSPVAGIQWVETHDR